MSSYLDLPTYNYGNMTPEEKNALLVGNIKEPTVIRGMYQPRAMKMNISQIVRMFGNVSLPIEIYFLGTHSLPTLIRLYQNLP